MRHEFIHVGGGTQWCRCGNWMSDEDGAAFVKAWDEHVAESRAS